jgi:hypothetical protein
MAATRRRKAPPPDPGSAGRRLAQTIAFHRWTLGTPIDDHFMTPEQMRQMPLPPEPAPQSRKAEQHLLTRVTRTLEVLSEERRSILAAARWPLAGIVTLTQGTRTRTVLAAEVYLLSSPLTDAERRELQARQDTQLREFDEGVAKTRPILLRLTEEGADPLFVLSVLVRYMPFKGTEIPKGQSVSLRSGEFNLEVLGDRAANPLAPLADWDAGRIDKLPFRLEGSKRIPSKPHARRRRGPPEAGPTSGMALLADHLATTTRQRHTRATAIAGLLRGWAPWIRGETYLTGKHVYNRIRRVKQSKDFRRAAREEQLRAQAEADLYASHFPSP